MPETEDVPLFIDIHNRVIIVHLDCIDDSIDIDRETTVMIT